MNNTKSVTMSLENVTFQYARVGTPTNAGFQGNNEAPMWNVQAVAEKGTEAYETLALLAESGVAVMENTEEGVLAINLKQYTQTMQGKPQFLNVYDANFQDMSEEDRKTVGDGSKGHVVFYAYEHGREGVDTTMATRMTDVVITEKVEFTPVTSGIEALKAKLGK